MERQQFAANTKEKDDPTMLESRTTHDEPESDDQGQYEYGNTTPQSSHPIFNSDCIGQGIGSTSTLLTLSNSSRKSCNYFIGSHIAFDDHPRYYEIDCDYSPEQIAELWFTKEEYDEFLKACDEDAQKCEAHAQVSKIKKELRKQKRKKKEEKRLLKLNPTGAEDVDPEDLDMDDDIIDDEDDTTCTASGETNKDEDEICDLGLEAWTLDGYKTREHRRQKSIDAVIDEQYAAWDRGIVENSEMMSALYFAASATSKHSSSLKARELEEDVREHLLVSALEDYSKAVQTLNVLQKSLHCIKSRNHNKRRNSK